MTWRAAQRVGEWRVRLRLERVAGLRRLLRGQPCHLRVVGGLLHSKGCDQRSDLVRPRVRIGRRLGRHTQQVRRRVGLGGERAVEVGCERGRRRAEGWHAGHPREQADLDPHRGHVRVGRLAHAAARRGVRRAAAADGGGDEGVQQVLSGPRKRLALVRGMRLEPLAVGRQYRCGRAVAANGEQLPAEPRMEAHARRGGGEEHGERARLRRGVQQHAVLARRRERPGGAGVGGAQPRCDLGVPGGFGLDARDQRCHDGRVALASRSGKPRLGL